MADAVSTLALKVDSRAATSELQKFGAATDQLGGKALDLKNRLLQMGTGLVGLGMGKKLLADAAYGQEALGKFEQVLGRYAKEAQNMVDELRANFNANTADAQQALSTMVDQFHKSGADMRQSLDMTFELQKLAGDLEAFTNAEGGVANVAAALSAGLMGTYMPLKKLGIVLNEDIVKERMATEKLEGLTFASKRAAQMHARYSLIMEQTAAAHGQVARESDNYNNKLRKFRATVADLSGELGEAIVPAATAIVSGLSTTVQWLEKLSPSAKTAVVATGAVVGGVMGLVPAIALAKYSFGGLTAAFVKKFTAMKQDTTATSANTVAEGANSTASSAVATAKNIEASARMRNAAAIGAENAALNSQSTANLTSSMTGGVHHAKGKGGSALLDAAMYAPMPGGKGAATVGRAALGTTTKQAVLSGYASRSLGGAAARGVLGRAATGVVGKAAVGAAGAGVLGQAASGVSKFLGVFKPVNGIFMKVAGTIGKVVGKLAFMLPFVGKLVGFLGKSAVIGKVVGLLGRFAGFFIPFAGWVSAAITALEVFKDAPKWMEVIYDKVGSKISEFTARIPELLKAGFVAAGNAIMKLGSWAGDLIVQGFLGYAQLMKRYLTSLPLVGGIFKKLLGDETEAQRAYKLNKQMEELNKKRQQILDVESKLRETEKKILGDAERAKKAQLRADLAAAEAKDTDQTKYARAGRELGKTQNEMNETRDKIQEKIDERAAVEEELTGIKDALANNAKERQDAIAKLWQGHTASELTANGGALEKSLRQQQKQIEADYSKKERDLYEGRDVTETDKDGNVKTKHINGLNDLNSKLGEIQETSGDLSAYADSLTESLANQKIEFEKLGDAIRASSKAAEQDRLAREEEAAQRADDRERHDLETAFSNAKTSQERITALSAQRDYEERQIAKAQEAQTKADNLDAEIRGIYARQNNQDVAKQIADLYDMANGDFDVGELKVDDLSEDEVAKLSEEEKEARATKLNELRNTAMKDAWENIRSNLQAQGFQTDSLTYDSADASATALIDLINNQQKADAERLGEAQEERSKAQSQADQLLSAEGNRDNLNRQIEDEQNNQEEADRTRKEEAERRERERQQLKRQRDDAYANEMHQRQLTMIDANINERDPWGAYNASAQKYDLIAGKGEADWNASQERLRTTQEEMQGLTGRISELTAKEEGGNATEAEIAERERLESRYGELESEYNTEYDQALQNRWSTEKELFGLQQTMAKEEDKQLRDYVTQEGDALKKQLEEQAAAEEEEYKKRLEERSEVEKEQRQAVSGAKAIAAGSSEAFAIQSKIYDRGQETMPPEKKIEKSTERIEKYVSQMTEQLYEYLAGNQTITLSMGY